MKKIRTPAELAAFQAEGRGQRGSLVSGSGRTIPIRSSLATKPLAGRQVPVNVAIPWWSAGGARTSVRSPYAAKPLGGYRVPATSLSSTPLPGGPYTFTQIMLLPINFTLWAVMWLSLFYLVAAAGVEMSPTRLAGGTTDMEALGRSMFDAIAWLRDQSGSLLSMIIGVPASPDMALMTSMVAFTGHTGMKVLSSGRRRRISTVRPRVDILDSDAEPTTDDRHLNPAAVQPASTSTPADDDLAGVRERRARRIAGVQAALTQLDAEWLSYELDLDAYYLSKPLLRDPSVSQTAAYQSALYELRELAESLGESSTVAEITAAEEAADEALMAWGAANDHALVVGVSDRSPTERAALRRLHALTGQLADPSTPEPMCSSLIEAITREMDKLSTVPTTWEHLARVPALEHRNPVAIAAAGAQ